MKQAPAYLRIAESIRKQIAQGKLGPGDRLPPVRELASQWKCSPGTVNSAYAELAREGLVVGQRGGGTHVATGPLAHERSAWRWTVLVNRAERYLLDAIGAGHTPAEAQAALAQALARWNESQDHPTAPTESPTITCIRFVGSHDLAVEYLFQILKRKHPDIDFDVEYKGSLGGLIAMARGEADLAGCHLWDEQSGTYNIPYVRRVLPGRKVAIFTLVYRRLGLIVAPDNPLHIERIEDLSRSDVRFINRQEGSGTRVWLDAHLRSLGISPEEVKGYDTIEITHTSVAKAVAEGHADVGLGIQAAATAYGLDFVQLTREEYDLVIDQKAWKTKGVQALLALARTTEFHDAVEAMGGYDTRDTGKETWL